MSLNTPDLFSPFKLRDVTFRNRIGMSPMCQYSSEDGFANDWHLVHLGSRAVGGAGMVMSEAAAVLPEGRISPQDLGIWKDAHVDMLRRIFRFVEHHGAVPAVQLAHAGRKASTAPPWNGGECVSEDEGGWKPVYAPSPIPFEPQDIVPTELDLAGIQRVVQAFAAAAQRSLDAGAKVVEIHAAHGYLLHEFLSPLTNLRTDGYGGSFENRTRALLEVVTAVREVWPERLPLLVRISSTDWVPGGWDGDHSVELAKMLKSMGVDMIDCSSGGAVPDAKVPVAPGYQVPFAERIRRETGMHTAAVGLITGAPQAEEIISTGKADMVFMARQLLRDPYWPLHAARELGHKLAPPVQYQRAF